MEQITKMNQNVLISKNGDYTYDLSSLMDDVTFVVSESINISINLTGFKDKNSVNFIIKDYANCDVRFIFENKKKDLNLQGDLSFSSSFNVYFADYIIDDLTFKSVINLNEENSKANVYFTSLGKLNNLKKIDVSFNHKVGNTSSNFDGYAVSMQDSFIKINGVTHIAKDANKCEAHQKVKCLLFDESSRAIANPVLKIDCDDIIASHACAIGSLNNEHIYYLLSRGLSLEEARRLIITGYLLPIKEHFNEEDSNKISNYVEGDF